MRGAMVESIHRGAIAVVDARGDLVGGVGDPTARVFARSAAKPFQAAAVVESGAADVFTVSDEELAVMCASHDGGPESVATVSALLGRMGVEPSALVCGSIEHMCSGKHVGMVALALHLGAPIEGYEQPRHPVQQEVARVVRSLLARRPGQSVRIGGMAGRPPGAALFAGADGCGVPVIRLGLCELAWLYAQLAAGVTPALTRVRDAMLAHAGLAGGARDFDHKAMQVASGRVVAKSGAEGVQALALLPTIGADPRTSVPVGCALKIEDGSARPMPLLGAVLLRAYDFAEAASAIEGQFPATIRDQRGRDVGRVGILVKPPDLRRGAATSGALDDPETGALGEDHAGTPSELGEAGSVEGRLGGVQVEGRDRGWWRRRGGSDREGAVTLREAQADDKDVLRFLREEWPAADEEAFGKPVEWIAEPLVLVMRRRRQVLAVLKGHFVGGVASVDELIVRRHQRGLGVGSVMLTRFEQEAARRGCARVVLRAVKGGKAEDFYRVRGYHRESVQLGYEFGYDYIRLTRVLEPGDD